MEVNGSKWEWGKENKQRTPGRWVIHDKWEILRRSLLAIPTYLTRFSWILSSRPWYCESLPCLVTASCVMKNIEAANNIVSCLSPIVFSLSPCTSCDCREIWWASQNYTSEAAQFIKKRLSFFLKGRTDDGCTFLPSVERNQRPFGRFFFLSDKAISLCSTLGKRRYRHN